MVSKAMERSRGRKVEEKDPLRQWLGSLVVFSNVLHRVCVRENEISGKDQVMGEMKVHKMKNRKESKSVSIKGKFSCRSMGKERR